MQTAYIALGANLPSWAGLPPATLAAAVERLDALGKITARSSLYSTEPVGKTDQPRFVNAVVALETGMAPYDLLKKLLAIEHEFGRDRSAGIPNGPRTLDLDILLLGDLKVHEAGLELPHPRLAERAFVLVPLHEIAPQLKIPGSTRNVAELLNSIQTHHKDDANAVVPMESKEWRTVAHP